MARRLAVAVTPPIPQIPTMRITAILLVLASVAAVITDWAADTGVPGARPVAVASALAAIGLVTWRYFARRLDRQG